MENTTAPYDVIIIGGSYAGLSAAMTLGRSRRKALIIDSGMPCNRQTPHAHNLITHDGNAPAAIAQKAREQVLAYPTVRFVQGKAVGVQGQNGDFRIESEDGEYFSAKRLLFTTGVRDIAPPIEGFAECWGISVLHCPYCHGYEVKDETLGVIANGDIGFEFTKLIRQWSKDLTLFTNGAATLNEAQRRLLSSHQIRLEEKTIVKIEHESGYLRELVFSDGSRQALTAVFARAGMEQHCDLPRQAGCEIQSEAMFAGLIKTDEFGKTSVPGIYAAGDNCSPMRSLSIAIAAGTKAGAFLNHELMTAAFQ